MKKLFTLFLVVLGLVSLAFGQTQYNITFRVDMTPYMTSFTEANVNGTFNGWCGSCNPLADGNNDNIWEGTVLVDSGAIEFKFTVDGWTDQEDFVPGWPCTVTDGGFTNRYYEAVADDTLDIFCWNSCWACNAPGPDSGTVSFAVDMRGYSGAPYTEVDVNGDWNAFCGTCNPLSDPDGDSIWTGSYFIPGGPQQFKYTINGWVAQENFLGGEPCTVTGSSGFTNRFVYVDGNEVVPQACWNSCDTCSSLVQLPDSGNITFSVDMKQYSQPFTEVNVNGTFNGWCGSCNPLTDMNGDSIWEGTVYISGGTHEFKFTIDGWTDQENFMGGEPCTVTNFGFTNRSLEVDGDSVRDVVCWNSCDTCTAVAPPQSGNITFSVDMSEYTDTTFTSIAVGGSWNSWCGNCNLLSDPDGDSIWTGTYLIPGGANEFKFVVDDWTDQEEFAGGEPCTVTNGGFTNRDLQVDGDSTLPVFCFEQCVGCDSTAAPTPMVNVTLQVDMSLETVNGNGIHVAGNFQGFDPAGTEMTDMDGDDVYEVTVQVMHGDTLLYKFINGNDWPFQEPNGPLAPCGQDDGFGGNNRLTAVDTVDVTLPVVCFGSCDTCSGAPIPMVNVTFKVDMSDETVGANGVHIAGSFQGWDPAGTEMLDGDGDGIYEVTVAAPESDSLLYKYINGNDWPDQEPTANLAACGADDGFGGYNRLTVTTTSDIVINEVCFGSCDTCDAIVISVEDQLASLNEFNVYPNPTAGMVTVHISLENHLAGVLNVYNVQGQLVSTDAFEGLSMDKEIDLSSNGSGMYWVVLRTKEGVASQKVIVK